MRVFILNALLLLLVTLSHGQKLNYKEVVNEDLIYILNNLEKITSYTNNNDLFITVYCVNDPSGSAGMENCEITQKYYIAVSEGGEGPELHLYRLPSVYAPKFVKWVKSATQPKLVFSYISGKERKIATVGITLRKLSVAIK